MPPLDDDLAVRIARDLFSDGRGQLVERLVLTTKDGRDLGGWGFAGAVGAIRRVIIWETKDGRS